MPVWIPDFHGPFTRLGWEVPLPVGHLPTALMLEEGKKPGSALPADEILISKLLLSSKCRRHCEQRHILLLFPRCCQQCTVRVFDSVFAAEENMRHALKVLMNPY